ncbi:MAG: hypothetical protein EOP50_10230 [Sphingobacteriales bacterium]|nr:MAG: hypothetical protein EOP50_10230 [Sphingobacteriales bacterium]
MKKIFAFFFCAVLAGGAAQAQTTTMNSESSHAAYTRSLDQQIAGINAKYDDLIARIQSNPGSSQAAKDRKIAQTNAARAHKIEMARQASARKEAQVVAQRNAKNGGSMNSTSNNAAYAASLDRQIASLNAKYDAEVARINADTRLSQSQKDLKIRQTNDARARKISEARAAARY